MANVGYQDNQVPPHNNQVPPLEEVAMGDHVPHVPPLMNDVEIRETFLTLAQAIISQDNVVTSQVQAMIAQLNREVRPRLPQHANTVVSCLRDFPRINPYMFNGSRSDENP